MSTTPNCAPNPADPPAPADAPAAPAAPPADGQPAAAAAQAAPSLAPFVLYVDDEEQALKYFKKAFAKSFDVLTATNVDEALALLEREQGRVGVLITDHRMPGKTGIELLARVKEKWSHVVRILVTAYADMESAIAAVNAGAVFKYLTKPIDLAQTKQVLTDAMDNFRADRQREAALTDQGSLLERMIVADRVRSMAALATGVSHHVRNSLTAMSCFFEELGQKSGAAAPGQPAAGQEAGYLDELLVLANKERERLVSMVRDVEARGLRPKFKWDHRADVADLITQAATTAGVPVDIEVPQGLATVAVDAEATDRMLRTLMVNAQRYSPKGATVRVTADGPVSYWNTMAVRVRVLGAGEWQQADVDAFFTPFSITTKTPGDVGLELFDAFQTAMGHEGDLVAHRTEPRGPGFEIHMPLDPAAVRRPALVDGQLKLAV